MYVLYYHGKMFMFSGYWFHQCKVVILWVTCCYIITKCYVNKTTIFQCTTNLLWKMFSVWINGRPYPPRLHYIHPDMALIYWKKMFRNETAFRIVSEVYIGIWERLQEDKDEMFMCHCKEFLTITLTEFYLWLYQGETLVLSKSYIGVQWSVAYAIRVTCYCIIILLYT